MVELRPIMVDRRGVEVLTIYHVMCDGTYVGILGVQPDSAIQLLREVSESQLEEIKKACDEKGNVTKDRKVVQPPPTMAEIEEMDKNA